nr:hypothetical protein HK105_004009 [Polyrhizophydium stewartii]
MQPECKETGGSPEDAARTGLVFQGLHDLLVRALTDPSPATLAKLHTALIQRRADFGLIFHEPPRDKQLRQALDAGSVTIRGKVRQANQSFCRGVAQLADLLDLNEARAAALYNAAIAQRARFGDASDLEACLNLYFAERECLLNCLETMLSQFNSHDAAAESRRIVAMFLAELLPMLSGDHADPNAAGSQSLVIRLLALFRQSSAQIAAALASAQQAAQSGQQQPQQRDRGEMQALCMLRARSLSREQFCLANLLVLAAHDHRLTAAELAGLVRLIQETPRSDSTFPYLVCALLAQLDNNSLASQSLAPRFVLGEQAYRQLRELFISAQWNDSTAKGVAWLAWIIFLDPYARSSALADPIVRGLADQELDGSRRTWFSQFGNDPATYRLLTECLLLSDRGDSEKPGLRTSSTARGDATARGRSAPAAGAQPGGPSLDGGVSAAPQTPAEQLAKVIETLAPDVREDVSARAIVIVEGLVRTLVLRMRRYLRSSMTTDQDIAMAQESQQLNFASRAAAGLARAAAHAAQPSITSWEAFLALLTRLYAGRPDAAVDWFAHAELFGFLKMSSEVQLPRFIVAFVDFLTAIAEGPVCAFQTHEILNNDQACEFGHILWSTFFRTLNGYIDRLNQPVPAAELQPDEAQLIAAFLRLLARVVSSSFTARRVLCENQHFRALHTLFMLLVSRIHVEMKAAFLEAIAAFCTPTDEGAEIVQQVWILLEQSQIVPTLSTATGAGAPASGDRRVGLQGDALLAGAQGIAFDLLEIETSLQTYPETLAFLRLLKTLLSNPPNSLVAAVYENLGSPDRVGGIRPYLRFVIDDVLLRISERPFANPRERWVVIEACLQIIQLSVALFDMSELQLARDSDLAAASGAGAAVSQSGVAAGRALASGTSAGHSLQTRAPARSLAAQPGFEVVCRVLQGSRLTTTLFSILNAGVAELSASSTMLDQEHSHAPLSSVGSILRIVLDILANQRVFLEILAPALVESGDEVVFQLPVSMVGLDQLLAYNKQAIVDISSLVTSADSGVCLASIGILSHLSVSPVFSAIDSSGAFGGSPNRLVSVLLGSDESNRILQGFVDRLELDEPEESTDTAFDLAFFGGARSRPSQSGEQNGQFFGLDMPGSARMGGDRKGAAPAIRCAILDLLLTNLRRVGGPNLAHFLLGFDCQRDMASSELVDPSTPKGRINCFHAIIELLARGIVRRAGDDDQAVGGAHDDELAFSAPPAPGDRVSGALPLSATHPMLSEKCFHLIYQLCKDRVTGPPTMRYLRTREDFFLLQLVALDPANVRSDVGDMPPSEALVARLHQQAWLIRAVTLELHTTWLAGQRTHIVRLLNHLFGLSAASASIVRTARAQHDVADYGNSSTDASNMDQDVEYEQPLAKILDLLKSMDFSEPPRPDLDWSFVAQGISLDDFVRRDERDLDLYDLRAIYYALVSAARNSERQFSLGGLPIVGGSSSNGARGVGAAGASLDSGVLSRDAVKDFVKGVFAINETHKLSNARFEIATAWGQLVLVATLECVEMIPAELRELRIFELLSGLLQKLSRGGTAMPIGKALSEVVTALMSRLHLDSRAQGIFKGMPVSMDPGKLDSWQHTILRGIIDGMLVPGTSLAMRGNYYSALITYAQYVSPYDAAASPPNAAGLVGDTAGGAVLSSKRFLASLSIINSYGDRLIETICRDASDGELVWQTVAYAALASLCNLCNLEGVARGAKFNPILDFLVRRNFLGHFVQTIKAVDDGHLRALLSSTSDVLNAKYVYDLKMSLLLKIADTKLGADRLVNIGILEALAEVQFIDERPDYGSAENGIEQERYHDAIMPVLQLVLSIQSHYQPTNAVVRAKASDSMGIARFMDAHRDIVAVSLRDKTPKATISSLSQLRLFTSILVWMRGETALLTKKVCARNLRIKYVLSSEWKSNVVAVTELEIEKTRTVPAKVLSPVSAMSVFAIEAEELGEQIAVNLLTYFIERGLSGMVFLRSIVHEEAYNGRGADVGDVMVGRSVDMLRGFSERLLQAVSRLKTIQMKAADISQIAQSFNRAAFEELSPSQRQMLAWRDLKSAEQQVSKEIQRLQALVEMASLFLLRLVEGGGVSADDASASKAAAAVPVLEKLLAANLGDDFLRLCVRCLA